MQVESRGSRVSRSSDQTRQNQDGGRKGERGIGLADTKGCQGHSKVFRISELLLLIHSRFCIYSQTIA